MLGREHLRRERLLVVLNILGFLPEHYSSDVDFETHPGKFLPDKEPKIAWRKAKDGHYDFLFKESFNEMVAEFRACGKIEEDVKLPYDWTLYYLRKKALSKPILKEELAWIILNFNKKRGYKENRAERTEEKENEIQEVVTAKIVSVEQKEPSKKKGFWYDVILDNGEIYRRSSAVSLNNWVGETKDFLRTTKLDKDGNPKMTKDGKKDISYKMPTADDWMLLKKKAQNSIDESGKTVGAYIFDNLLENSSLKINGNLIGTIDRAYYVNELKQILKTQAQFHPELRDKDLYHQAVNALYVNNEAFKKSISARDMNYLIIDNTLFYQRPLKTKKHLIDECPYEFHLHVDPKNPSEKKKSYLKCAPKSSPLFQEFRLWQFISNIRMYRLDDSGAKEREVTSELLKSHEDYANLFRWLNDKETISQKQFFKYPGFKLGKESESYSWNYSDSQNYVCNETRAFMLKLIKKAKIGKFDLDNETETKLWHILYSVEDPEELKKALQKFAEQRNLDNKFVEAFSKSKSLPKDYGSYSSKALGKLLPLMRHGSMWSKDDIDSETLARIEKIINGEADDSISVRTREKFSDCTAIEDFQGLPLWKACYAVYDRHSEASEITKWETPHDIDVFLSQFKQHSLHNPIVEQVVLETLRVVRDIWERVGNIDEIHIEMGRDIKQPASKRKEDNVRMRENEDRNLRLRKMLQEFANPSYEIEAVRPNSPSQLETLKIYEESVLDSVPEDKRPDYVDDFIKKVNSKDSVSSSDFMRYKLWLDQKYRSPYTGESIPLAKLFTSDYQIEHVIPRARYYDDSLSNKVICESEVNKEKDALLAHDFIRKNGGKIISTGMGKKVRILSVDEYEQLVKEVFAKNRAKMEKLMLDDVPEGFINRQLNDTRYISRYILGLLSNIVRDKDENGQYEQEAISKNIITLPGRITDRVKKDWGVTEIWNRLVENRFKQLNQKITGTDDGPFGHWTEKDGKRFFQIDMPLELQRGFSKKRIDHRHHAMDAIVIASVSRNLINYLNNEAAAEKDSEVRRDLRRLLCDKVYDAEHQNYTWIVKKPWESFTAEMMKALEEIVVSTKQNLRVINKTTNAYVKFGEDGKKRVFHQTLGDSWAIRKSLHKDTVYGRINIRQIESAKLSEAIANPTRIVKKDLRKEILELLSKGMDEKEIKKYLLESKKWKIEDIANVQMYVFSDETSNPLVSTRKAVDTSFKKETIEKAVYDKTTRDILLKHLGNCGNDSEIAFSPEGIEEMNRNIIQLNGGKFHHPIRKVKLMEALGVKFQVGETGNKTKKYVVTDEGTNLFYGVYVNAQGKREFATIPLREVIVREKEGLSPIPEVNEKGSTLLFSLSPNNLVYLPSDDDKDKVALESGEIDPKRIFRVVKFSKDRLFVRLASMTKGIVDKTTVSKSNISDDGWENDLLEVTNDKNRISFRNSCVPVKVNRLGEINRIDISKYFPKPQG